jgi:putative FmdB family regulatory protein
VREETAIPTYRYRCEACGETFERVETITEHGTDKKPRCPKCDGEEVVQVPTPFVAMTGKKS